jgi:hypothetical protein
LYTILYFGYNTAPVDRQSALDANPEYFALVSKTDLSGSRTNERTNPNKSIEDRLIEIVRVNSTISKTALAHELGIGRTKLYELLATMTHRVRSTGGTRHVEWTVLED